VTRTELAKLARLAIAVADDLDHRGYGGAPAVRRIAQALTELSVADVLTDDTACPRCGKPVNQAPTGRPRVYCSTSCRQAAHRGTKRRRKATMRHEYS
jgi:predicted nucleic acid-binding Zn ribbon protein